MVSSIANDAEHLPTDLAPSSRFQMPEPIVAGGGSTTVGAGTGGALRMNQLGSFSDSIDADSRVTIERSLCSGVRILNKIWLPALTLTRFGNSWVQHIDHVFLL